MFAEQDFVQTQCKALLTHVARKCDGRSSYKEHTVDALAPSAEEGRGKLRKASGSRKRA